MTNQEETGERFTPEPVAARDPDSLPPAAKRALAEAVARRAAVTLAPPREIDGRGGLEPVRYGDWEVKGLTPDF